MSNFKEQMKRLDKQNKEFDALVELMKKYEQLSRIAVVDDDYPEARHNYEGALKVFIEALKENGRL